MTQVIDAHVHAFSDDVQRDRDRLLQVDHWFGHLYENPKAVLTSERELIESMDHAGIERSIIAGFPWNDPGRCREQNAWMAEICRQYPARLSFLATVMPHDTHAVQDVADALDHGALGVGELNADAQGFDFTDPAPMADVMELCRDRKVPVMFHASEPVGHVYPGKGTATPERLIVFLSRFPDQPVVFAHWGGGLPFHELMPEIREITRNVTYDTAATTYLYRFRIFPAVTRICGPDRILFGSDFPVLGQQPLLDRVRAVVPDSDCAAILGGNAATVYGLER